MSWDDFEMERREAPPGEDLAEVAGAEPGDLDDRKLFSADHGRLPFGVRTALVRLLRGPYLSRSSASWEAMITYEKAIRSWFGEIFLELVVNHDEGVAFTRQLKPEDLPGKAPVLLRPVRLAYFEAVLLLVLRERLNVSESLGERAVVGLTREEIRENLQIHGKKDETNLAGLDSRINAAIRRFEQDYKLLRKLPGGDSRYEISPVIKLIVTPDLVRDLAEELSSIRSEREAQGDAKRGQMFGGDDVVIESPGGSFASPADKAVAEKLGRLGVPEFISPTPVIIDGDEESLGYNVGGLGGGEGGEGEDAEGEDAEDEGDA